MKSAILLLAATALHAAGPAGPVSGWTLDIRTATIRAIVGIPGALRLADPLSLPNGIAAAEFAPSGDLAVALTTDQPAHLVIVSALKSTPVLTDLGEAAPDARILARNATGTAAILYSASLQTLRFATALDQAPVLSDPVSTAALAGPVTAGVLDATGCAILATGSIETLCADGSTHRLIQSTSLSVTALALANTEKDLWIADAAGQQILRAQNSPQQSETAVFASSVQPIALAVMPNGLIVAADATAQALLVIDPSGSPLQQIALDIVPTQLRPLTDRTLLLLNNLDSLPFTLFTSEGMRTYFVPAN